MPLPVKIEPNLEGERREVLYSEHDIKQELVLGPIVLQRSDLAQQLNGQSSAVINGKQKELTLHTTLSTGQMISENMGTDNVPNQPAHTNQASTDMPPARVKQEPVVDDDLLLVADLGTDEMVRLGLTPETMGADYEKCQNMLAAAVKKEATLLKESQGADVSVVLPASHADDHLKEEVLKDELGGDCKNGVYRRSPRITNKQKAEKTNKQELKQKTEITKYSSRLCFETDSEDNDTDSEYEEPKFKDDSGSEENLEEPKQKNKVKKPKKRHICEFCNKEFRFRASLTNHIRTHTGEKPYSCNQCSKRFSDCAVLVRHRRMHAGDKPHTCEICGKKYSEKYLLKNHKLVHTGEMQYFCKFCPKQFVNSSNYRRHQKVHNMNKYVCDMCNKSFEKKDHLRSHIVNHTKPKPYTCKHCKKGFGQKGHLNRHLMTHTGMKNMYTCGVCKIEFTQKVSLKRHMDRNVCKKKLKT